MNNVLWSDIMDVDSYKLSHWKQYPPNTTWAMSYLEARGGAGDYTVFFGLQYLLQSCLSGNVTIDAAMLEHIATMCTEHGLPFNIEGWQYIIDLGYLPLKIRAVPEGTIVPKGNVMMTVESTDEKCPWLVSWVETMLSRLWYPINVATLAHQCRTMIQTYLNQTSDDPESIWYKLHDFGSRGSSSCESAMIASMAHLTSFKGTDTLMGIVGAAGYYDCAMAGHAIPASEHSTITMWGKDRELDAYRNMLRNFASGGAVFACVSDSYDIFHAVKNLWGTDLKAELVDMGGVLVVRPDSGDPGSVSVQVLDILARQFGATLNSKNYRVLNKAVRVIWGDGMNYDSLNDLLGRITRAGYATSNMAFGMGGALVQKHDRDSHKMAYKCCAATVDGKLVPVYKEPITDPGKKSKSGILDLVLDGDGKMVTVDRMGRSSLMRTVLHNGTLYNRETLDTIRERLWPSTGNC